MDEHTADDLVEDSDDEKRIEKAEKAADQRKAGKQWKKHGAASVKSHGSPSHFPDHVFQWLSSSQ